MYPNGLYKFLSNHLNNIEGVDSKNPNSNIFRFSNSLHSLLILSDF